MPEYLEDYLYCAGVLHGYRGWLLGHGRKPEFTILGRPEWIHLLRPAIPDASASFVTHLNGESKSADFVFEFDRQRAYDWSLPNKATAALAYGTLLGAGSGMATPLYGRKGNELPMVLFLPRHRADYRPEVQWDAGRLIHTLKPLTTLQVGILDPKGTLQFAYEAISAAALCVGVAGGLTLLAASLGKPLLELYPTDLYHEHWSTKWDLAQSGNPQPNYRVIRDKLAGIHPDFVADSTVKMLNSIWKKNPLWSRFVKDGNLWQSKKSDALENSESQIMTAR